MKTVLIVIGIVCVICCGGAAAIFFVGKNAVDGLMKTAQAYGDEAIPAICTEWDLDAMKAHAAPELVQQQPKELENVMNVCMETYGPMKSFTGKVPLEDMESKTVNKDTLIRMHYVANLVCEKGNANVDLELISRDAKTWKILKINVLPGAK